MAARRERPTTREGAFQCTDCKLWKSPDQFRPETPRKDGSPRWEPECRSCHNAAQRITQPIKRAARREGDNARQRATRRSYADKERRHRWRYLARLKGVIQTVYDRGFSWSEMGRLAGISRCVFRKIRDGMIEMVTQRVTILIDALLIETANLPETDHADRLRIAGERMEPWRARYPGGHRYPELEINNLIHKGRGGMIG